MRPHVLLPGSLIRHIASVTPPERYQGGTCQFISRLCQPEIEPVHAGYVYGKCERIENADLTDPFVCQKCLAYYQYRVTGDTAALNDVDETMGTIPLFDL
jgi:hypothetical protein